MKYIKPYQIFEASASAPHALTKRQINWLDKCAAGRWNLNPQTGFVDVVGDFDCGEQGLTDFKGVKFGKVSGYFDCDDSQLTSLEGAPQTVGGYFSCYGNELTSLVGAPQSVKGGFYCEGNNPVSESTLSGIFALMKSGMAYQKALEEYWPEMGDEDRAVLYKQMTNLPPEETRKYKALAMYNNIKGYL